MSPYPWRSPDWIDPEWTPRQLDVLPLIAEGRTNAEIAQTLGVTVASAKWHVSEVITKLGAARREEVAAYWRWRNSRRHRYRNAVSAVATAASLKLTAVVAGVVALAIGTGMVASVLTHKDGEPGVARVATVDAAFEDGVYCEPDRDFCIVEPLDGGAFIGLSTLTSHDYFRAKGCTARWLGVQDNDYLAQYIPPGDIGVFREPCGGATFLRDGTLVFGPAERSLDRHPVTEEDGTLTIDLRTLVTGAPTPTPDPCLTANPTGPARDRC